MINLLFRGLGVAAVAGALAACTPQVQTSSGREYVARSNAAFEAAARASGAESNAVVPANQRADIDRDVVKIASVEPLLTFPARIGIARIEDGTLTMMPELEARAFQAAAEELGPDWGEFVPISPLITAMVGTSVARTHADSRHRYNHGGNYGTHLNALLADIRRGAARQHVDVVLIYEVTAYSESTSNPLALSKFLLIGYVIAPSENIDAVGSAQAMLVDVRNGYTYGFTSATVDRATLSTSVNERENMAGLAEAAKVTAGAALAPKIVEMGRNLRLELAERRAASLDRALVAKMASGEGTSAAGR